MKTITNNNWRNFVYRSDVPADILADQFDWASGDDYTDGFFRYRSYWYHISEFTSGAPVDGWQGFQADTFFSGVAINISSDGEQYQVATIFA